MLQLIIIICILIIIKRIKLVWRYQLILAWLANNLGTHMISFDQVWALLSTVADCIVLFCVAILIQRHKYLTRNELGSSVNDYWLSDVRHRRWVFYVWKLRRQLGWICSGCSRNSWLCLLRLRTSWLASWGSWLLANRFQRTIELQLLTLLFIWQDIGPDLESQFFFHVILFLKQHFFLVLLAIGPSEFLIAHLCIINKFLIVFLFVLSTGVNQLVLV